MRRGGYKCRTLEMNLQLREQLKTISYTYRLISKLQNNCKPKTTIDTQTRKINSNTTLNLVIKLQKDRTREGKKKEQQKQIQSS